MSFKQEIKFTIRLNDKLNTKHKILNNIFKLNNILKIKINLMYNRNNVTQLILTMR